jgi:carbon-monoxide dehydrogenase large subunit
MDYALPTASMVPRYEMDHTVTTTPNNPMGAKGVGEAGTIGAAAAVVNAAVDALSPLGVKHVDMPLKAEKIWRLIQAGGR